MSHRLRIILLIFFLEAILCGLVIFQTVRSVSTHQYDLVRSSGDVLLRSIASQASSALLNEDYESLDHAVSHAIAINNLPARIVLTDHNGMIVVDSSDQDIGERFTGGADWQVMDVGDRKAGVAGQVAVRFEAAAFPVTTAQLGIGPILVALVGMLAIAVIGFVFSAYVGQRARKVTSVAERVLAGDLSARPQVSGNDEIRAIADAFSKTLDQLTAAIREHQVAEERYRVLLDNAPDAIAVFELPSMKFVDGNRAAEAFFGLTVAEARQRGIRPIDYWPEYQYENVRSVDAAKEWMTKVMMGESISVAWKLYNGRKEVRDVLLSMVPILGPDGRRSIRASTVDITDKRALAMEAHKALLRAKTAEEMFRTIFETAPDAMSLHDMNRQMEVIASNPARNRLLEIDTSEQAGTPARRSWDFWPEYQPDGRLSVDAIRPYAVRVFRGETCTFEFTLRSTSGRTFPAQITLVPIRLPDGRMILRNSFVDITDRKRHENELAKLNSQLAYEASHDDLTGLLNRRALVRSIEEWVSKLKVYSDRKCSLLYIDLNFFRQVVTQDPKFADLVLVNTGHILEDGLKASGVASYQLSRIGDDTFALLLEDTGLQRAVAVADSLRCLLREAKFENDGIRHTITMSVGVIELHAFMNNSAEPLRTALQLCLAADDLGGDRVCSSEDEGTLVRHSADTIGYLESLRAIEEGRVALYAQKIQPLVESTDLYELSIRMLTPQGGQMLAATNRESVGRMHYRKKLDTALLAAVQNEKSLAREQGHYRPIYCFNLASSTLLQTGFSADFLKHMSDAGIDPSRLCIELTEPSVAARLVPIAAVMRELRSAGVMFALDHFTSAHSSLRLLLKDYEPGMISFVKIDIPMFGDQVSAQKSELIQSMVKFVHTADVQAIAMNVDTEAGIELAKDCGFDYAQGKAAANPYRLTSVLRLVEQAG